MIPPIKIIGVNSVLAAYNALMFSNYPKILKQSIYFNYFKKLYFYVSILLLEYQRYQISLRKIRGITWKIKQIFNQYQGFGT